MIFLNRTPVKDNDVLFAKHSLAGTSITSLHAPKVLYTLPHTWISDPIRSRPFIAYGATTSVSAVLFVLIFQCPALPMASLDNTARLCDTS